MQISGGIAHVDGRLQIGDIVTHLNGDDLRKLKADDCIVLFKSLQGAINLKIVRPTPKRR